MGPARRVAAIRPAPAAAGLRGAISATGLRRHGGTRLSGAGISLELGTRNLELPRMFLAIEIGGTKLQLAAGDADGRIVRRWRHTVDRADGAAGIRAQIAATLPEVLAAGDAAAVGVGFGGAGGRRTGRNARAHPIQGWLGFGRAARRADAAPGLRGQRRQRRCARRGAERRGTGGRSRVLRHARERRGRRAGRGRTDLPWRAAGRGGDRPCPARQVGHARRAAVQRLGRGRAHPRGGGAASGQPAGAVHRHRDARRGALPRPRAGGRRPAGAGHPQ